MPTGQPNEPTAQDQYMLELLNRARLNPQAEADRLLSGNLNEGLSPGTITAAAKQPLAFNLKLFQAARDHSQWMIDHDVFDHVGINNSQPWDRATTAGYPWKSTTANGWIGENIDWIPVQTAGDVTKAVKIQQERLFVDTVVSNRGHRLSILNANYREIGISAVTGQFTYTTNQGQTVTEEVVMTTQDFGSDLDPNAFLTGVVYTDGVLNDDFYTVGEGLGNITIHAVNSNGQAFTSTSLTAGGYSLRLAPGTYNIDFSGDFNGDGRVDTSTIRTVTIGNTNVKLDFAADTYVEIPEISLAVTDAAAGEAANPGKFTLSRMGSITQALTVSYTIAGTATNATDYQNLTKTVTFKAGERTAVIDITSIDDQIFEGNETVTITLNDGGNNYTLTNLKSGTVTIADNDPVPTVTINNISINEGNNGTTNATFTVSLSNPSSQPITVDYETIDGTAIAGSDYNPIDPTTLTFAAGETTKTITVGIIGNLIKEADETFSLVLSNPSNATLGTAKTGTATILNEDTFVLPIVSIATNDANAAETKTVETSNPGQFTLTRTGDLTQSLIVNYSLTGTASNGTDYQSLPGTVTFQAGAQQATIDIKPLDDNSYEGNETVTLTLNDGGNNYDLNTVTSGTVTIADNDPVPTVTIDNISINEGNNGTTNATFTVNLSNPSSKPVTVQYATTDGTAIAGSDYNKIDPTTLTFAAGETTKTITVGIIGNLIKEADETFTVTLTNPTNATLGTAKTGTATILNEDTLVIPVISIDINDPNAAETKTLETSNPGRFTLTRTGDLAQSLNVNYSLAGTATNGTDYQSLSGTVTFKAGANQATLDIQPIDDKFYEGNESVTLTLNDSNNYDLNTVTSGTVTIADNDSPKPQISQSTPNLLEIEGGTAKSLLKFTKIGHEAAGKNEICIFIVDDEQGRINGIKPGEKGYVAAALDRAQTIFSSLGNNPLDRQFDQTSERYLNFAPGARVQCCLISDSTLDEVKADLKNGKPTAPILFSLPGANSGNSNLVKFTPLANNSGYEIAWHSVNDGKTTDFNDLVLKVEAVDGVTPTIGTNLQGKSEGELIDLRSFVGKTLKVDTTAVSDAAYNNYIGFYAVEDAQGTLANGLKPTDAGYAQAAIKIALLNTFKTETTADRNVSGGKILAPVVITNGKVEDFLTKNPQNVADSDIHAYFNYLGANPDHLDHFRLLGDNKFGVEDMFGGGDRDYNDIVIQMNIKT